MPPKAAPRVLVPLGRGPSPAAVAALAPMGVVVLSMGLLLRYALKMLNDKGNGGLLARMAFEAAKRALASLPDEVRASVTGAFYLSVPVSIAGAIGGVGWKLYNMLHSRFMHFLERHCKVTMTFMNNDKHYDIVVDYIGTRCSVETGRILASTRPRSRPSWQERVASWLGGKMQAPTLYYQPDIQSFSNYFKWVDEDGQEHQIWLHRHVEKPQFRSDSNKQKDPETLFLTMWWTTDPTPLKNFMAAALKTMLREDSEGKVDIYVKHMWWPNWTKAISKEKRDRDTIVLDENLADYVLEDLKHFFSKRAADWYHNAGVPYRRGYLLYGPPGCGKTSFAQVLAGELGLDVCLMNLSNQEMNDDDLAELLRNAPARSMLLLEDVDAIFVQRSSATEGKRGGISFSGLLNALDGAAAQEGCVIVLTTNHKDRLDEALVRPGRCDVHVHIQKASQDQAKRMFWRFFAKEAKVRSTEPSGIIQTVAPHGFKTGDAVTCRHGGAGVASEELRLNGKLVDARRVLYVHVPGGELHSAQRKLRLYASAVDAMHGGSDNVLVPSEGREAKLATLPEAGVRFSSRIPDKQVSMAKLQGYLMKQRLDAEQHFKVLRDKGELAASLCDPDMDEEEQRFLFNEEVTRFAAEASVINVHELLDVKVEAEDVRVSIYDHFRRVGLARFAPIFEHYGIREKKDITAELKDRMQEWDPDLKHGPQRDRLVALLEGNTALDRPYSLADLSVLRDCFIAAFQSALQNPEPPSPLKKGLEQLPPTPTPDRIKSDCPTGSPAPPRLALLRQGSGVNAPETQLNLLDLAHKFQETLESNGKTDVSLWQLDMHFQRYHGDPRGALENAHNLRRPAGSRTPEERTAKHVTTFEFLRRIGLEENAFNFEDKGLKLWSDWKHFSKDELQSQADMSSADATFCHAVVSANKERPHLLRKFHMPGFADLKHLFLDRFPEASAEEARRFALQLTDDAGATYVSCLQVEKYLKDAASTAEALQKIAEGLPTTEVADKARVKPESPPPPAEPTDWVYLWLKPAGLQHHSQAFLGQALEKREDILDAPLNHKALEEMGINKIGERCRILNLIAKERGVAPQA